MLGLLNRFNVHVAQLGHKQYIFPVRQYLLYHKHVIYVSFLPAYTWTDHVKVSWLLIILQYGSSDEEPAVRYLGLFFRFMARIECIACISKMLASKDITCRSRLIAKRWRWFSTNLPFTRTSCVVSTRMYLYFVCFLPVWLVLNWFNRICFSTIDRDYKLEPRPYLNSHMFLLCLHGDFFSYRTVWSVNCTLLYCVYLDSDAIWILFLSALFMYTQSVICSLL